MTESIHSLVYMILHSPNNYILIVGYRHHMKKIKIGFLLIDNHSGQGGLEKVLIDITQGLKKYDIFSEIIFISPPTDSSFLKNFDKTQIVLDGQSPHLWGPKFIKRIFLKSLFKKNIRQKLPTILQEINIDALVILDISKKFLHILPAIQEYKNNNPNAALIAWPHISFRTMPLNFIKKTREAMPIFDSTFSISQGMSRELSDLYDLDNISLIYNPIKPASLLPKRNHKKFIYLGRVNDSRKRVYELLKIFQNITGNWHLDLIGGTGTKAGDKEFQKYISSLGLEDRVYLSGWTNKPWDLVTETGTLLLNSTYEGFGLVLAEAMMRGIPCLSSDCPVGPNEIIQNNINGWLYEVDDEQKLQTIIQEIVDGKRKLPSQELIIQSVQKFSADIVIENFKNCILDAIQKK